MTSFQAIAGSNNVSLAVVAPGIAEALFATALGLLAAIPATIAYNRLTETSGKLIARMEGFADALPAALGDGLRKRVAIARALTLEPEVVLFDEPTTSLDPVSARRTDQLIARLCRDDGVTAVVVSHDLSSIFGIADRIAMLYKGGVRFLGTPEEFRACDDPVVRQFVRGEAEGPMEV